MEGTTRRETTERRSNLRDPTDADDTARDCPRENNSTPNCNEGPLAVSWNSVVATTVPDSVDLSPRSENRERKKEQTNELLGK